MTIRFGYCIDNGTPPRGSCRTASRNAQEEYYELTGIRPTHVFAGDSLQDQLTSAALVASGGASVDAQVQDTIPTYQAGKLWSHAYEITADPGKLEETTLGDVIIGSGSFMLHLTVFPTSVPGVGLLAHAVGNYDGSVGLSLRLTETDQIQLDAHPSGGALTTITRNPGAATSNLWDEWVVIVDRSSNVVRFGDVRGESSAGISAGSLDGVAKFRLGTGTLDAALLGKYMRLVIAHGAQVEGRSARELAEKSASSVWWDAVRSRVLEAAR